MNRTVHCVACMAGALLLAGGLCFAQVRELPAGQALDANYQIGSGGYNVVNGGNAGVNSQLYVTGQVTGLAAFHGRVGYYAPNQVNLNLPGDEMATFRGQSVGVNDVLTQSVYQTAPYYAANRTVVGSQLLGAGASNIINGISRTGIDQATADKLYIDATADYQPLIAMQPVPSVNSMLPVKSSLDIPNANILPPAYNPYEQVDFRPGAAAFFGVASVQGREQLARELADVDRRNNQQVDAQVNASATPKPNDATAGNQPDGGNVPTPNSPPGMANPPGAGKTADAGNTGRTESTGNRPRGQTDMSGVGIDRASMLVQPNQDVFLDLLVGLQEKKAGRAQLPTGVDTAQDDLKLRTPSIAKPDESTGGGARAARTPGNRFERQAVEVSLKGIVVHELAGARADQFNLYMAAGQRKLRGGKFYEAASQFEMASAIRSSNPLSDIGAGLAYFGAGEPSSAAVYFHQAIAIFPPIIETRIDVGAMIDMAVFDREMARTESRIAEPAGQNDTRLLLAASYMHYQAGQDLQAKKYATMLKNATGVDRISAAFADYVLTGRKPTSQPAR